jgi:hypothetical protein
MSQSMRKIINGAAPLFDSGNDWTHSTLRLIGRKQYAHEGISQEGRP